jgi:hypothetical protein
VFTHYVNRSNEIWLGALKTKLEFGKEEALKSLWSLDSPFEGNVKLSHDNSQEDR